ncbi:MAG TPA: discoidin domain-containing protein [Thermoanaerobaculia bacterium]|nr:discoidin domain-containing protein [Thermoanaerobaculia bacterium]
MRARFVLTLLAALAACREADPGGPAGPRISAAQLAENENLLNIGWGAAVVSRTGELALESSAIRAIDGDADTAWASPPLDPEQTLLFSLPAPAHIDRVGFATPVIPHRRTTALTIEASSDGRSFTLLLSPELEQSAEPQFFDVLATEARYIRVTTRKGGRRVAALKSVYVRGRWLEAPSVPPIGDCWTVNGSPASFTESEGRVTGSVGAEQPLYVDGGVHEAVYRFAWARGPEWGYALVTLTPGGDHLSGMTWHEEAAAHSFGTSWFGERRPCRPEPIDPDAVVTTFIRRAGWYPLFSLRFDSADALVEPASAGGVQIIENVQRRLRSERFRIVAHEYRGATPQENRRRAEARLQSLRAALQRRGVELSRIDFVARGGDSPRRPTASESMRLLYGVVEIQLPDKARAAF